MMYEILVRDGEMQDVPDCQQLRTMGSLIVVP